MRTHICTHTVFLDKSNFKKPSLRAPGLITNGIGWIAKCLQLHTYMPSQDTTNQLNV